MITIETRDVRQSGILFKLDATRLLRRKMSCRRIMPVMLATAIAFVSVATAGPASAQTEDARFLPLAPVKIQPASRVENITSPPGDLPDQEFQTVDFNRALTTSLVTVNDLSPAGFRAYVISLRLEGGGFVHFSAKEGQPDVMLSLTQPIKVSGISVRCDSFSETRCRYQISLTGN